MPQPDPPPAVSLIIPAHDRERFVAAAVGSVLRQTFGDLELIVWDDGSSDRTAEVALRAGGNDSRLRVVRGEHRGVCAVLNAAARECTGRYLGWVDSDDALAPAALERTVAVLESNPEVGLVYTRHATIDEEGYVLGPGERALIPYSKARLLIDFMTFHFRLLRRSLFDRVGGLDETAELAEDYDLCLTLSELTEVAHVPEELYFYRQHEGAISRRRKVEQILKSREVIQRALVRRGLAGDVDIHLEIVGRFTLRKKA